MALLMGTTLAHALEMPGNMRVPGALWLTFQHTLYARFATVGAVFELGSIASTAVLAYLQRGNRAAFRLTAAAAILVALAFFAVWLGFTNPVNARTAVWTADSLPADWSRWRSQWEYSHLVRFALHLLAFSALVAMITRTRGDA